MNITTANTENKTYSLEEIETLLRENALPFCGVTPLGSARFIFLEPSVTAGVALHSGSRVRKELHDILIVSDEDRFREEDPRTNLFIETLPIQVIALDSRFEYDLNRYEYRTIPATPESAWGLHVWKRPLTEAEKQTTYLKYREFHQLMDILSDYLTGQNKPAYIFDLHSYCYQHGEQLPWHLDSKPEINLGTKPINQVLFREEIDLLTEQLKRISVGGRKIRVAENELFGGGYMARRLCKRHFNKLAVFAIEFKKIFMDEWTGEFYPEVFAELKEQFEGILKGWL